MQLEADKLISRLKAKDIALSLSPEALSLIIKNGYDPQYGARPMRRAIERLLEDPLAEALLRGDVKAGDKIEAVQTDGAETLHFLHIADKPAEKVKTPRKRAPRKPSQAQGGIILLRNRQAPHSYAGVYAFEGNREQTLKNSQEERVHPSRSHHHGDTSFAYLVRDMLAICACIPATPFHRKNGRRPVPSWNGPSPP